MKKPQQRKSPSMLLKEWADKHNTTARFAYTSDLSIPHLPKFNCFAYLRDKELGSGSASNKKDAKHRACLEVLKTLTQREEAKQTLREMYHGKEHACPENPVSAINELGQKEKWEVTFESKEVCRVFIDGALAGSAEGNSAVDAKRQCCSKALEKLNSDPPRTASEPPLSPSLLYLSLKHSELQLTKDQATEQQTAISSILALKPVLCDCGVVDICVVGAAAAGILRRTKLVIDIGLLTHGEIDMSQCAAAIAPTVLDPMRAVGELLAFAKIDTEACAKSPTATLRHGCFLIRLMQMRPDAPAVVHAQWVKSTPFSLYQKAAMRVMRHWVSLKPGRRPIPPPLIDYLVYSSSSSEDSVGLCVRKAMESLSGGAFLPGKQLPEAHIQSIYCDWEDREKELVAGEAFVAVVLIARGEVASVV